MPIYRYECITCGARREEIHNYSEPAPLSRCCEAGQIRLMPRRVRARVLEPGQAQAMQARLNGFFDIVEQMRAVDTTGVEPLAHPTAVIDQVALRLRDDVVSEPNQREANQVSAPAVEDGLFLVPKVIE
jgi:aspartyl-tRNA(Asn)/glutamyl-tRNA(Gln) amidotransferase subunit C